MKKADLRLGSSFRDPSGFIFKRDNQVYRQINSCYQQAYNLYIKSGLHQELASEGLVIKYEETKEKAAERDAFKVIRPEPIPFISYPYEWSFSQLKDAALLTLAIADRALEKGMILKDASAYNIQFLKGKPIFIDTLSFDIYKEGQAWDAYGQFCRHFLAPLALASHVDIRLIQLLRIYMDGIPLDLASSLLPKRTQLGLSGLAVNIHLHAKSQKKYAGNTGRLVKTVSIPKSGLKNILNGLKNSILNLNWKPSGTDWADYYSDTNYSAEALGIKGQLVSKYIDRVSPKTAWDLGANNGLFSRVASQKGIYTIASDIDPAAVEQNYLLIKQTGDQCMLPLVVDLTNPSASIGWANAERQSFIDRSPVDLVIALALIHHLAISNNLPLESVAQLFAKLGKWCIIEFVPKTDSQVKRLLSARKDIFTSYNQEGFESAFGNYFSIRSKEIISGTERVLYLMQSKPH